LTESGLTQEDTTKGGPFVRFDVFMLVLMMMAVFCHLKPCGLLSSYWHFRGGCHLQSSRKRISAKGMGVI